MSKRSTRRASSGGRLAVIIVLVAVILTAAVWYLSNHESAPGGQGQSAGSGEDALQPLSSTNKILLNEEELPDCTSPVALVSESGDTVISLNKSSVVIDGSGASFEDGTLLIDRAGVYQLSGELDGRIVVNAKGENVVLVLNGVSVNSQQSAAIYVYKAKTVTLIANESYVNSFVDGESYDYSLDLCSAADEEPDAAIFSKADMIIRGTGTIQVSGRYRGGIVSRDTLKIVNTTVEVTAVNNGITGKDSLTIENSTLRVDSGNDGLRSTKSDDPSLGYISMVNSNISVVSGGDAVQAETGVSVENCSIKLISGGGAFSEATDSQKGIKCVQGGVDIISGYIYMDCADDSINAMGDVKISGGVMNLSSGDDGVHSDSQVSVSGGTTVVTMCREGLEGMSVDISGGVVYINSKSDGINAAGGSDNQGFDGTAEFMPNESNKISVSGGYVYIRAEDDGVDSNGNIELSGGTLIIAGSTQGDKGALDYNGDFSLTGGTLLAYGARQMAQAPDNPGQKTISVSFDSVIPAETVVNIKCGEESFTFITEQQMENMVFSSPALQGGSECVVSYGGKYTGGENLDCVYSGGRYSGGSELSLSLDSGLSVYGQVGMGGSRGGRTVGSPGERGGF